MAQSPPNAGVPFIYEGVNTYLKWKVGQIGESLPEPLANPPSDVSDLVRSLFEYAKAKDISIPECTENHTYTWEKKINNLSEAEKQTLWIYREYVFSSVILWVGIYFSAGHTTFQLGENPVRDFTGHDIRNNRFTVVGSVNKTSDIDVTITGPASYVLIAVLEDMFLYIHNSGIPVKCWDVEFYGDYHLQNNMFINVRRFGQDDLLKILRYAYMGYFRSTGFDAGAQDPEVSAMAKAFGKLYLHKLQPIASSNELDDMARASIADAAHLYREKLPGNRMNREEFYRHAMRVETDLANLTRNNANSDAIASNVFFEIAEGNIHRPESYILASTAVHVVDIEQQRLVSGNRSIQRSITKTIDLGVSGALYIASALEQLGYLEHYHSRENRCNTKGVKYFGRMIRALEKSDTLAAGALRDYRDPYVRLNAYRKTPVGECPIDILEQLDALHTEIAKYLTSIRPVARSVAALHWKSVNAAPSANAVRIQTPPPILAELNEYATVGGRRTVRKTRKYPRSTIQKRSIKKNRTRRQRRRV